MSSTAEELPRVRWQDAGHAVAWADELCSRPQVVSPTAQVINRMRGTVLASAGGYSAQDYRDLAETVLTCLSGVYSIHADALRVIYGLPGESQKQRLSEEIAMVVDREPGEHTYSQASRLGRAAVLRERSRQWNQRPMGRSVYAWALQVPRDAIRRNGWPPLIRVAEQTINQWAEAGGHELMASLQERDLM